MRVTENIGKKYGMWTILKNIWNWKWHYLCKCDCWNEKVVQLYHIKSWKSKSCWCLRKQVTSDRHKRWEIKYWKPSLTHGMTWSKIYGLWANMMSSIKNTKFTKYKYVWWKWITCEERWNDFQQFYDDIKDKYELAIKEIWDSVSLCRIDTDKNYDNDNIYFWTKTDWMKQWDREYIIWDWIRYTTYDLIRKLWISQPIAKRIIKKKWTKEQFEKYLFKRVKKFKYKWERYTAKELADSLWLEVINKRTIFNRIVDNWMTVENAVFDGHRRKTSWLEDDVDDYVKSLWFETKRQKHIWWSMPCDVDIYIESKNLCIEYNGNYHHSFYKLKRKNKKTWEDETNYKHQYNRTKYIREAWYDLLIIRWDQRKHNRECINDIIKNKLWLGIKIFARETKIKELTKKEFNSFCNVNHLQWAGRWAWFRIWLEYNWEIVSVMWFKWNEIIRFCSKLWNNVVGWFSKLLQYFIKNNQKYKEIVSTANLDIVNNNKNVYIKNWFKRLWKESIDYFYYVSNGQKRQHKSRRARDKIEKHFSCKIPMWETERSFMDKKWYYQCYHSGTQKYILELPTWNWLTNHYI